MQDSMALEVVMSWEGAPLHAELLTRPGDVTVSDRAEATFTLPSEIVQGGFTLARHDESGWLLYIPAGATACLEERDEAGRIVPVDLAALPCDASGGREVRLSERSGAEVQLGVFSFFVRPTQRPDTKVPRARPDFGALRFILASFVFHGMILALFLMSPPDASAMNLDLTDQQRAYIRVRLDAVERDRPDPLEALGDSDAAATNEGQPMNGEQGAAGDVDETRNTGGQVAVRGQSDDRRVPRTARDVRAMNTFSVLANSIATLTHDISSPYGADDAAGFSEESLYGPLMADAAGFGPGGGGFAMLGVGRGACPRGATNCADGAVGVGDLNTIGSRDGCDRATFERFVEEHGRAGAMERCTGTGRVPPARVGTREGRPPPRIRALPPVLRGGLSSEQVRRVVRRNIGQVRHCYSQALLGRPDLEGRVSVRFVILQDGAVQSSMISGSDLDHAQTERCISTAVQRWTFPSTDGLTVVTYPFRLQSPS